MPPDLPVTPPENWTVSHVAVPDSSAQQPTVAIVFVSDDNIRSPDSVCPDCRLGPALLARLIAAGDLTRTGLR